MVKKRTVYYNGKYNLWKYGPKAYTWESGHLLYGVCPAGIQIRRSIGKKYTYRIRWGNGYYGSTLKKRYQDKYKYFVPDSINNPQGEPFRVVFRAAVLSWQSLSEEDKNIWRLKGKKPPYVSGYNLYISNYMKIHFIVYFGEHYFGTVKYFYN